MFSKLCSIDIFILSNQNIHKSSCGLCIWASDPLIDRFYKNLSIKVSEAQKKATWTFMNVVIWKKSILNVGTYQYMKQAILDYSPAE